MVPVSSVIEHGAVAAGRHVVQFYEDDADLVARAGGYLLEGALAGEVAIVIATEAHRTAFEAHLRDVGVDVAAARDEGTLVLLDAAATLESFKRDGSVDRDAFFEVIGGVVNAAAATGRPVRAYGEMVALLWEAGDVLAAIDLETLWNELGSEVPFSLYCAYRSESVLGHEHAAALQRVCHLHSAVVPVPLAETTWRFAARRTAPGDARRLLTDALQRSGHDDELLHDARLVLTELAANAVVHSRLPFSISIRSEESTLHIRVRDHSQVLPVMLEHSATRPSGRGLRLLTTLTSRWGVDVVPDGKVVWAEFAR
jgi:anti-sigma regulatory factor (Ser/Thr protein kinase)